jgi:uncharacterized protein
VSKLSNDYLTAQLEQVAKPPTPVKIVIAGGFGVGKTTMVGAISDIKPLTTEAAMTAQSIGIDDRGQVLTKTTTTVAMDFGRTRLDESLMLYVFGTPGQDRFGFMWDDLVHGALAAVVLVDTRRIDDSYAAVDYFENRDLPFVVAVNLFEGQTRPDLEEIRDLIDLSPGTPITYVDARAKESVKEVMLTGLRHSLAVAEAAIFAGPAGSIAKLNRPHDFRRTEADPETTSSPD